MVSLFWKWGNWGSEQSDSSNFESRTVQLQSCSDHRSHSLPLAKKMPCELKSLGVYYLATFLKKKANTKCEMSLNPATCLLNNVKCCETQLSSLVVGMCNIGYAGGAVLYVNDWNGCPHCRNVSFPLTLTEKKCKIQQTKL